METNLAAFAASFECARGGGATAAASPDTMSARAAIPTEFAERIERSFPEAARPMIAHGVERLLDYQDRAYAGEYLQRLIPIATLEADGDRPGHLTRTVARGLALWMAIEDTIRVAQLKTRSGRTDSIRRSVGERPGQVIEICEFLKPRVEEICGTLPAGIGRRLLASPAWRRRLKRFTGDRTVNTTSIGGYLLLRAVASLRRWRRGTLRYQTERAQIDGWLGTVAEIARVDYELALQLAECQRLVRGYGDTYQRGLENFERILASARALAGKANAAQVLARLLRAAQADDHGEAIGHELALLGSRS